jgi:hypothetical protein
VSVMDYMQMLRALGIDVSIEHAVRALYGLKGSSSNVLTVSACAAACCSQHLLTCSPAHLLTCSRAAWRGVACGVDRSVRVRSPNASFLPIPLRV